MKKITTLMLALLFSGILFGQSGYITTKAGTGTAGYTGDGAAATAATLNYPEGIVFDAQGNYYVADSKNNVIRKVTSGGVISTYAGTGVAGYSGDGGKATAAKIHAPYGLAIDAKKNIYVADLANHVVRKIDSLGKISTFAGSGSYGYSGDGSSATNAKLYSPCGLAWSSTKGLYISDSRNNVIRRVDTSGNISTFAGTGSAGYTGDGGQASVATFNTPRGLCIDKNGYIYVADNLNHAVRKIVTTGTVTTVAGTGTAGYTGDSGNATAATLDYPSGVAVDSASIHLYIADQGNHVIRKISSGTITTYAGNGTGHGTNVGGYSGDGAAATSAKLQLPAAIYFDLNYNCFITDCGNNVVRRIQK